MSSVDLSAPTGELSVLAGSRRFEPGTHALKHALLTSMPLCFADFATIVLVALLSAKAVAWGGSPDLHGMATILPLIGAQLFIFISVGLYPGVGMNPIVELRLLTWGTLLAFGVCLAATLLSTALPAGSNLALILGCVISLVALPLVRNAVRSLCANYDWWGQRVLIFGSGPAALLAYQYLMARKSHGLRPIGMVDDTAPSDEVRLEGCYLGTTTSSADIAMDHEATWAMIVMPERSQQEIMQVVSRYAGSFPHLLVAANMEGMPTLWTRGHECAGLPGLRVNEQLLLPVPRMMKRVMDLSLIVLAAPLLLPVFAVIAFLIKRNSAGPIFFRQQRIGRDGDLFYAWKFRTMVQNADVALAEYLAANPAAQAEWNLDHKLRDDPRITKIGNFLRKSSLDELPQLWNVLRGEMSLVGPRPIVAAEVSKYADSFGLYTKVRPGITGLWQISGRNDTTYDERVEYDAFYARNWSPFLDIYILARTIKVVLLREGAY